MVALKTSSLVRAELQPLIARQLRCHSLASYRSVSRVCRVQTAMQPFLGAVSSSMMQVKEAPRLYSPARTSAQNGAANSQGGEAVIIVDHGSKRQESNKQLEDFVQMYRKTCNGQMVVAAHMELASPSIKDAVSLCAESGCTQVVVAPYFLSQGRHIQQDIPALVEEARREHPEVTCIIADPIGLDDGMVDIIKQRVTAAATLKTPLQ